MIQLQQAKTSMCEHGHPTGDSQDLLMVYLFLLRRQFRADVLPCYADCSVQLVQVPQSMEGFVCLALALPGVQVRDANVPPLRVDLRPGLSRTSIPLIAALRPDESDNSVESAHLGTVHRFTDVCRS